MPYVHRTALGEIDSLHRQPLPGASEFLDNDHPEVQRFVGGAAASADNFNQLDADFVRVIEDVIDALIMKNVIAITDLRPCRPSSSRARACATASAASRCGCSRTPASRR
jgi:hypothetical protein